jgi:hypothetical protein
MLRAMHFSFPVHVLQLIARCCTILRFRIGETSYGRCALRDARKVDGFESPKEPRLYGLYLTPYVPRHANGSYWASWSTFGSRGIVNVEHCDHPFGS